MQFQQAIKYFHAFHLVPGNLLDGAHSAMECEEISYFCISSAQILRKRWDLLVRNAIFNFFNVLYITQKYD